MMSDLLWFVAELFIRLILVCVWVAAGLVALAVTGLVAVGMMAWRKRRGRT